MTSQTDWTIVWPFAAAALAFGLVYGVTLAGGAPVETVLLRATGALLAVGLASFVLRGLLVAALPPEEPPTGATIDITLPAADPNDPALPAASPPEQAMTGRRP